MIKMIITDLDGTLLNDKGAVSPYTLSVFERCKKEGIKIVIATFRGTLEAEGIIDILKADFSILNNGAIIFDSNKKTFHNELLSFDVQTDKNDKLEGNVTFDKKNAIEILSKSQNISLSEIVAFGDGLNDLGMIQNCGIGIATENAIPEVKEIAKGICGNNNEDGVAKWIKEYILA